MTATFISSTPGILAAPNRHLRLQIVLNLLRHLLKERARGAAASGATRDLRREAAQTERLQDLLCDPHLFGPISAGRRSEGDANRIADSLLEENAESRGARNDSLGAEPGLGQTEMEGIVASARPTSGTRLPDPGPPRPWRSARSDRAPCRPPRPTARTAVRSRPWPPSSRRARPRGSAARGVGIHHRREQLLVERAPVDADPHRFLVSVSATSMMARKFSSCRLPPTLPG